MDNAIDGRPALVKFLQQLQPRQEIPLVELLPGGQFELPLGFTVTDYDADQVLIVGPFETVVTVRSQGYFGGAIAVTGEKLTAGLMLAAHVGEPVWERSLEARKAWRLRQFEQAPAFTVTVPEPRTREELERHITSCASCATVGEAYSKALDAGMNATDERALRDLYRRSHEDREAAIEYYRTKEAIHRATPAPISADKPARRASRRPEVPA